MMALETRARTFGFVMVNDEEINSFGIDSASLEP